MDGQPRSHIRMPDRFVVAQPTPASAREDRLFDLIERQRATIAQLADQVDLLERLLAPPGPRAWARLRRSPWHVRLLRALVG